MRVTHIDDAKAIILEYIRKYKNKENPYFGYQIYLPTVIEEYLKGNGSLPHYAQYPADQPQVREISSAFLDGAWDLCRHGILRPSVERFGGQGSSDGVGFSVTESGRRWIAADEPPIFIAEPDRLSQLFQGFLPRLGPGFFQRASEAARCYGANAYIACCSMCGAAAESILLAVAVAKSGNEKSILAVYRTANGRHRIIDDIVGQSRQAIKDQFRNATGLLTYWRDAAAHGVTTTISEIEAHEAIGRLIRFAQFTTDNWNESVRV
ncbi:MAG: hypothetical protein ACREFB_19655 [Stellaceae bacterium]